jgi:hypothetical protein
MRRAFATGFQVWLAVASLGIAMLGSAAVVLCVSNTGHVAIEAFTDDCCRDTEVPAGAAAHTDQCACIHTRVLHAAAGASIGTERLLIAWVARPIATVIFGEDLQPASARSALPAYEQPRRASTELSRLRTVVLLA